MLSTPQCLDENAACDLIEGTLSGEARKRAEAHIDACPACRRFIAELVRVRTGKAAATPSLPEATTEIGEAPAPAAATLERGTSVGRYLVLGRLGAGGMGIVYLAYDPDLDRKVALKLLLRRFDAASQEEMRSRLVREAQAMAQLTHPNVISVFDIGTHEGNVFIAMEYVDGFTLRSWLSETPHSWREVVRVFLQAGEGLEAAHRAGFVHRDFKPDNVLISKQGEVRVTDFGLVQTSPRPEPTTLARTESPAMAETLTRTGTFLGTPAYMPPEQIQGSPCDARSDQFSFCVALHQAVYGRLPFSGDSVEERLRALTAGWVKPTTGPRGAPAWLERVIGRGLSASPGDRYPTMGALLADLRRGPLRRRRFALGAVALAVLAVIGGREIARSGRASLCRGGREHLGGVWDADRKQILAAAFGAAGGAVGARIWKAFERDLDQYAERWVAAANEACEATQVRGDQSEALLDLRMICLGDRLKEMAALVSLYERPEASSIERATTAAGTLQNVSVCAKREDLLNRVRPPGDPTVRRQVDELRGRMAVVRAHLAGGRFLEGLPLVSSVADDATKLGYRPLEAEALGLLGNFQTELGEIEEAVRSLTRAGWAAQAGRDDREAAIAWTDLVYVVGFFQEKYDEADAWAEHAKAALERLGSDEQIEAALLGNLGTLAWARGRIRESLDLSRKALALDEKLYGSDHTEVASSLNSISNALHYLGPIAEAEATARRALEIFERLLGPEHPRTVTVNMNLSLIVFDRGDDRAAEAMQRQALQLRRAALSDDHVDVAMTQAALAQTLTATGRAGEALSLARTSLATMDRRTGPQTTETAVSLAVLGDALRETGRPAEALVHHRRALAVLEDLGNPENRSDLAAVLKRIGRDLQAAGRHKEAFGFLRRAAQAGKEAFGEASPHRANALRALGETEVALGRRDDARTTLAAALVSAELGARPTDLAATRLALARVLPAAERARARTLAQGALELYRTAGPAFEPFARRAAAWIAGTR